MSLTTDNMKEREMDTEKQNHINFINLDSNIAKENYDSSQEQPNINNLREIRLKYFRQRQPPVRYRHSVGSPSLLMSDTIREVTAKSQCQTTETPLQKKPWY